MGGRVAAVKRGRLTPSGGQVLGAVFPNAGLEAAYSKRLTAIVDELHRSVHYWVKAAYRANEPVLAQDETPAAALLRSIKQLRKRWLARFDVASEQLADYFATSIKDRSDAVLKKILKDGGFSVEFKMSPAMRDVFQATVGENVALIKSIPAQYLDRVEGYVMRSVQTGRDLKQLTDDLESNFKITRRRAEFIARSQNNMATASMTRARRLDLGITTAVWLHSHAGAHPRASHLANNGKEFDIKTGWMDPEVGHEIQPGELPNCRCSSKVVIPGFS